MRISLNGHGRIDAQADEKTGMGMRTIVFVTRDEVKTIRTKVIPVSVLRRNPTARRMKQSQMERTMFSNQFCYPVSRALYAEQDSVQVHDGRGGAGPAGVKRRLVLSWSTAAHEEGEKRAEACPAMHADSRWMG